MAGFRPGVAPITNAQSHDALVAKPEIEEEQHAPAFVSMSRGVNGN